MIEKLELLLALAKERHFGRAAEACGVTQPTMSTSLKQLEEILGVMLVQRGSRFQGFTPEGERTLDWARRIVGDTRAMKQEINGLKDKLSGEIRIAAIPTVLGMVASLTTPFRARHPDVRFRIQSCTSADVNDRMRNSTSGCRARNGVVSDATMPSAVGMAAILISPESLSLRLLISCFIARVSPTIRRAQSSVRSPSGVKP